MKVRLHADPFVDQLASLCRAHVTRSKWVFVPSHAIGRTLGERIALEGSIRRVSDGFQRLNRSEELLLFVGGAATHFVKICGVAQRDV
jgi:hypothetical protein